ncbi:Uncharacterised protein [Citrobacter koseri]|uniref:Uncharacterized protein n=1 Tax=Citrobacter koseri TaxID=545 RepID=A0A2X2V6J9_CITKO|nr:Uncharacterised protein [Citrobacter koseri]
MPLWKKLRNGGTPALAINAFPKLSASTLLYKLNPAVKEGKNKIYALMPFCANGMRKRLRVIKKANC